MNQKTEGKPAKISLKKYLRELKYLHGELVALQRWVQREGLKVCIIFEGRDGAGKGGTIKAITERVSPRIFRTVALPTPTEREKARFTCNATFRTCRPQAKSSSSTAAGTTGPAWSA